MLATCDSKTLKFHRRPLLVVSIRLTGISPFVLRTLLSSTADTPFLFLGRLSLESRVICGKQRDSAANMDCGPSRATIRAVPSYGISGPAGVVTMSVKLSAICKPERLLRHIQHSCFKKLKVGFDNHCILTRMFASEALGRTISNEYKVVNKFQVHQSSGRTSTKSTQAEPAAFR